MADVNERPDIDRLADTVQMWPNSAQAKAALDELVALARGHDAAIERNCDLLERSTAAEARVAELERDIELRDLNALDPSAVWALSDERHDLRRRVAELEIAYSDMATDRDAQRARVAELERERDSIAGTLLTALRTAEGFERRIAELEAALRTVAEMRSTPDARTGRWHEVARAALAGDGGGA